MFMRLPLWARDALPLVTQELTAPQAEPAHGTGKGGGAAATAPQTEMLQSAHSEVLAARAWFSGGICVSFWYGITLS
jgi:hypothetical protein